MRRTSDLSRRSAALLLLAAPWGLRAAAAPPAGDAAAAALLARVDAVSRVPDAHLVLDVKVTDARGDTATRVIEIWQQGDARRLVKMVEPARLRGVGLLVNGDDIHLFLPAYPPARRVTGSGKADAFLGTDFAVEDLARTAWAPGHVARTEPVSPSGDRALRLTPTGGGPDILLTVGDDDVIRSATHFDAGGAPRRRIGFSDVRAVHGVLLAHRMLVEDLRARRRTEASLRSAAVGQGVDPSRFTLASLESP
jgi:hypothetical protein